MKDSLDVPTKLMIPVQENKEMCVCVCGCACDVRTHIG